ncbi:MAG: ABC transporter ATP-binding protein [Bdellovibrionota bacterium]
MTSALSINNLNYAYKSNWSLKRTPGLIDIKLNLEQGETFGFLGQSGAGKTTTIKCILGLLKPTRGEIKIFGEDATQAHARRSVGYLPEQPYFYDHLSVKETVAMFANLCGIPKSEVEKASKLAISKVALDHKANSSLKSLSKGLTQRVAMAQAIVANPKLLILDEPFSGLDPLGRKEIADLLFELRSKGTSIFMSSHILSDVESVCDRVSIMRGGRIKGIFEIDKIPEEFSDIKYELVIKTNGTSLDSLKKAAISHKEQGELFYFYYGDSDLAQQKLQLAISAGHLVESYSFTRPNLEDIFVKLTKESGDN